MTEHKEKTHHWYIRRAVSYGLTISCLHDESFHEAGFKERTGCHYDETLFVSQNHLKDLLRLSLLKGNDAEREKALR